MHTTEILHEYLATKKIRRFLTAWAGDMPQHPLKHTEELSNYLIGPATLSFSKGPLYMRA